MDIGKVAGTSLLQVLFMGKLPEFGHIKEITVLTRQGGSIWSVLAGQKKFELKSAIPLVPGEKIRVSSQKNKTGIELKIIERVFGNGERLSLASDLPGNLSEKSGESMVKVFKTLFPGLAWQENTPWVKWKTGDSESELYYFPDNEKNILYFIIKMQNSAMANVKLLWNRDNFRELMFSVLLNDADLYYRAVRDIGVLEKYLSEKNMSLKSVTISFNPQDKSLKEWTV